MSQPDDHAVVDATPEEAAIVAKIVATGHSIGGFTHEGLSHPDAPWSVTIISIEDGNEVTTERGKTRLAALKLALAAAKK